MRMNLPSFSQFFRAIFDKNKKIEMYFNNPVKIPIYLSRNEFNSQFQRSNLKPLKKNEILLAFDLDKTLYSGSQPEIIAFEVCTMLRTYFKQQKKEQRAKQNFYENLLSSHSSMSNQFDLNILTKYCKWDTLTDDVKKLITDQSFLNELSGKYLYDYVHPSEMLIQTFENLINSRKQKYRLIILTNASEGHTRKTLQKMGIEHFFEAVFYWNEYHDPNHRFLKPSLRAYEMVENYYKIIETNESTCCLYDQKHDSVSIKTNKMKQIYFFDDMEENIHASNFLHWKGIHISPYDNIVDVIDRTILAYDPLRPSTSKFHSV